MDSLETFPTELLSIIIVDLTTRDSLKSLSSVSRRFRILCVPFLFHRLRVDFSIAGFKRLEQISVSDIAQYVKVIQYYAPELIDPCAESWDYFRSCVYPPAEYVRDQKDLIWSFRGKQVPYKDIYTYFSHLVHEQRKILQRCVDLRSLCTSFPRFRGLQSIEVEFADGIKSPFRWFASRLFVDWEESFLLHFEALLDAILATKREGTRITSLKISGFYSHLPMTDFYLAEKLTAAVEDIASLHLIDSPYLLDAMTTVPFPALRQLVLGHCWLGESELGGFVTNKADTLQCLELNNVSVSAEKVHPSGISLYRCDIQAVAESMLRIRSQGILRRIIINGIVW
ncbi:hypothetical protein BO99DRAFT_347395 [Aspergillus violaceofuscus CBS 115571]|uniref:F-box domain-containing protein n=1 Tax=Aspergillus violaceofuscus (strain CBS 115571) TaxID=1450538 RepID=A0A2V5GW98_ASPV1|nr:hypothetical protein BO99DRAFT_347395 [Aspergillus violaceofuscus CBS 115571]